MHMLGTVIYNLRRLTNWLTTAMSNVTTLMQQLLSKIIGVLTIVATQSAALVSNLSLQFALIVQKCKALLAQITILVSSIKAVLTTAKATLIQIGSQPVTTVRQIPQRVLSLLTQSSAPVAKIKSGLLLIQKQAIALIPMGSQLKDSGLKLLETVRQLPQRVLQALSKGR